MRPASRRDWGMLTSPRPLAIGGEQNQRGARCAPTEFAKSRLGSTVQYGQEGVASGQSSKSSGPPPAPRELAKASWDAGRTDESWALQSEHFQECVATTARRALFKVNRREIEAPN